MLESSLCQQFWLSGLPDNQKGEVLVGVKLGKLYTNFHDSLPLSSQAAVKVQSMTFRICTCLSPFVAK